MARGLPSQSNDPLHSGDVMVNDQSDIEKMANIHGPVLGDLMDFLQDILKDQVNQARAAEKARNPRGFEYHEAAAKRTRAWIESLTFTINQNAVLEHEAEKLAMQITRLENKLNVRQ